MLVLALVAAGCGRPATRDRVARDQEAAAESARSAREVDAALEAVEARLYSGRTTVRLWQELASRHKGVSAVACRSAQAHAEGMALADRKDRARLAKLRLAKTASLATDAPHVGGYQTTRAAPGKAAKKKGR